MSNCANIMTVDEWFKTTGKMEFRLSCENKVNLMNDILRLLWIDTYDTKPNICYKEFGPGIQNVTTDFPIYYMEGFYAKKSAGSCECPGAIFEKIHEQCDRCSKSKHMKLWMRDIGQTPELLPCQYSFCRDSNEIEINVPNCVESGYFKYFRGPDVITSVDDKLPITWSLLPALKLLFKAYYVEIAGSAFAGDSTLYEARYAKVIEGYKKKDALKMEFIQGPGAMI